MRLQLKAGLRHVLLSSSAARLPQSSSRAEGGDVTAYGTKRRKSMSAPMSAVGGLCCKSRKLQGRKFLAEKAAAKLSASNNPSSSTHAKDISEIMTAGAILLSGTGVSRSAAARSRINTPRPRFNTSKASGHRVAACCPKSDHQPGPAAPAKQTPIANCP